MSIDLRSGLSLSSVVRQQEESGYNELPTVRSRRLHQIAVGIIKEPMVYLLLGCGIIYFIIGDQQEALMLLGFLFLILGISFFQERKAEKALEALRELASPRALVIRDGKKQRVAARELVCGDLIVISEGDRVPADAALVSASFIAANESLLTGESMPVEKAIQDSVFAGTTIVRGSGLAVVSAIGLKTEIGKIGRFLHFTDRELTELEIHTNDLVKNVAWIAGLVCLVVAIMYSMSRGNWIDGFLVGLTLAMAILPNEIPAVLTIFLALGAWRMARRRVLARKLSAIENLGAATVLCVDKTGTLTINQMAIQKLSTSASELDLSESTQTTLPEEFHEVLEFGILASRKDPFDPMELAFASAGLRYLEGTEHLHKDWSLEKEYPLSPQLLSLTHAWKPQAGGGFVIGAKGAPEAILDLCHLSPEVLRGLRNKAERMAQDGLRVLGVARAFSAEEPLPAHQHDFEFFFVGFIGISDPIRSEAPLAVAECQSAGIRLLMLTGDHPLTASSIGRKIGLKNVERVITGVELGAMTEQEVLASVKECDIFSRVSAAQKLQIVNALKKSGEVVAMTGDGVNDAPALKSANIGIAMGKRGTDVAREAADLVLLDDDFGSIVDSIKMGRRIYENLQSAMIYLFTVHIPILGMSVLPVVLNLPLVLLPAHIAFLHLIIEPVSSVAFEMEAAALDVMRRPPRNSQESLFNRQVWLPSFLRGFSILVALVVVFLFSLAEGAGEQSARTLVFVTLLGANVMLMIKKFTLTKNRVAAGIVIGTILFLIMALYRPELRELLHFSSPNPYLIVGSFGVGVVSVLWAEWILKKYLLVKTK